MVECGQSAGKSWLTPQRLHARLLRLLKSKDEDIVRSSWRHEVAHRYRANSAVLNTLLEVMNERTFDDGTGRKKCPLRMLMGATNETPSGEKADSLAAFHDRFLVRKVVRPIQSQTNLSEMLFNNQEVSFQEEERISGVELDMCSVATNKIVFSENTKSTLMKIFSELKKEGIDPSDRRKAKSLKLARASAWLAGRTEVSQEDLSPLCHALWVDEETQAKIVKKVVGNHADPDGQKVSELLAQYDEILENTDTKSQQACSLALPKVGQVVKDLKKIDSEKARRATKKVGAGWNDLKCKLIEASE